jgi:hypothetical protein
MSRPSKAKKSERGSKIKSKKVTYKEPEQEDDKFELPDLDFIPLIREDSDENMNSQRISTNSSQENTPNASETRKSSGLKLMEYSSPSFAPKNQILVSPIKKTNFSTFAYVLESQLNDHMLANSQADAIIQELISGALACHRKLSLNLPGGVSREMIKSPKSSEMKEAHDVVKKLLDFCDVFEQIVYDIRLLQQSMQYHMNQSVRIKEDADREVRD